MSKLITLQVAHRTFSTVLRHVSLFAVIVLFSALRKTEE